jgi:hypothetical protein
MSGTHEQCQEHLIPDFHREINAAAAWTLANEEDQHWLPDEKVGQARGATEMSRRIMKRGGASPRFSTGSEPGFNHWRIRWLRINFMAKTGHLANNHPTATEKSMTTSTDVDSKKDDVSISDRRNGCNFFSRTKKRLWRTGDQTDRTDTEHAAFLNAVGTPRATPCDSGAKSMFMRGSTVMRDVINSRSVTPCEVQ